MSRHIHRRYSHPRQAATVPSTPPPTPPTPPTPFLTPLSHPASTEAPEMVVGPVYALRGWILAPGGWLTSVAVPYVWDRGDDARAQCLYPYTYEERAHPDPIPALWHGCGYYSVKPEWGNLLISDYPGEVVGVVELRGRVVEHTQGYRSEFATPRLIFTSVLSTPTNLNLLRHHYPHAEVRLTLGRDIERSLISAVDWIAREVTS